MTLEQFLEIGLSIVPFFVLSLAGGIVIVGATLIGDRRLKPKAIVYSVCIVGFFLLIVCGLSNALTSTLVGGSLFLATGEPSSLVTGTRPPMAYEARPIQVFTLTPTDTPTPPIASPTNTPIPTTPSPTDTPTPTDTPVTPTSTPTLTDTPIQPTSTPTETETPTPTYTDTFTPIPTPTPRLPAKCFEKPVRITNPDIGSEFLWNKPVAISGAAYGESFEEIWVEFYESEPEPDFGVNASGWQFIKKLQRETKPGVFEPAKQWGGESIPDPHMADLNWSASSTSQKNSGIKVWLRVLAKLKDGNARTILDSDCRVWIRLK